MAHTIMKQLYDSEKKKYIQCEVLVYDEEEDLPEGTDRREVILQCLESTTPFTEISDGYTSDEEGAYPETALIDQYEDFDNRQGQD